MRLKELNLVSFGKFQGDTILFDEGLNIIYGENESGKTTIHNFIDGMFYGFLRPYVSRRYYREEHRRYRPWNQESYRGTLRFSKEGMDYRIDRDFGEEKVKVYEDLTGRDITKDIDTGERVKLHLPGMHFFNFNTIVYNNTVSIRQLGNKIDSELSKEIKDRLANMSTSLDDDISVKEAISQLDRQLEMIGTERAYTKPYGKAINKLDELKRELEEARQQRVEYDGYVDESHILKKEIGDRKSRIEKLEEDLEKIEMLHIKRVYDEAVGIEDKLNEIDEDIGDLEVYSGLSFDEYSEGLKMHGDSENLKREIADLSNKLEDMEQELTDLGTGEDEMILDGISIEELDADMFQYTEVEEERNELIIGSHRNRLDILDSRLADMEGRVEESKTRRTISILLSLASVVLGLLNPVIVLGTLPLIGITLYFNRQYKRNRGEMEELKLEIEEMRLEEARRNDRLQWINEYQDGIMKKYDCASKVELNRLYDDMRLKSINLKDRMERIRGLETGIKDIRIKLDFKQEERQELEERLHILMKINNSGTLDEFKEGLEKKTLYDGLIKDRANKLEVLDNLLDGKTLEDLKDMASQYDEEYIEDIEGMDRDSIVERIDVEKQILSDMTNDLARLEERIDGLDRRVRDLVNIEEEIHRIEQLIQNFMDRIESINRAKEAIEKISKEIHEQFAPNINEWVSEVIHRITDGRYDCIRIDDDLDIAVENPNTQEIIEIDNLSGGTIDQLYFALRFGIINSIRGGNLPLILDDCFIQYDRERLGNILEFLAELSNDRQILLFTCHRREGEVLDELGFDYNLISI
ncbi:MAG: AAA family ATPase [Tissierellia bacterium]|nr:AAA family ATPase [Tissierellia bacterium]